MQPPARCPAPGAAIASIDRGHHRRPTTTRLPQAAFTGKTRYSDRAPVESKAKAAAKAAKAKQKVAATPAPLTAEEKAAQQVQNAPLGLSGDTASKKKKKKVKGAPKERIQEGLPRRLRRSLRPRPFRRRACATMASRL